jgi:hypothetical protein
MDELFVHMNGKFFEEKPVIFVAKRRKDRKGEKRILLFNVDA